MSCVNFNYINDFFQQIENSMLDMDETTTYSDVAIDAGPITIDFATVKMCPNKGIACGEVKELLGEPGDGNGFVRQMFADWCDEIDSGVIMAVVEDLPNELYTNISMLRYKNGEPTRDYFRVDYVYDEYPHKGTFRIETLIEGLPWNGSQFVFRGLF